MPTENNINMQQFEAVLGRIAFCQPPQFPYQEVANKLNNLKPNQITEGIITTIVYEATMTLPPYKKWNGKKKLYNMISNPAVKEMYKTIYNITE